MNYEKKFNQLWGHILDKTIEAKNTYFTAKESGNLDDLENLNKVWKVYSELLDFILIILREP